MLGESRQVQGALAGSGSVWAGLVGACGSLEAAAALNPSFCPSELWLSQTHLCTSLLWCLISIADSAGFKITLATHFQVRLKSVSRVV